MNRGVRAAILRLLTSVMVIWAAMTLAPLAHADADQDIKDAYQLIRSAKYDEALAKLQATLTASPEQLTKCKCQYWIGVAYEAKGQSDQAISSFEAAANLGDYRWAETLNKLAVRYRAKGNKVRSDEFIQRLIDRRATEEDPAVQLRADLLIGDCLRLKGDWKNALDHYRRIAPLYKDPESAQDILLSNRRLRPCRNSV